MDGLILLGVASLQQKNVPNVYAKASITVNIINMNESPICPHMVEAQRYSVVENSARGTVLNSNQGKYQAASADYLSDDGEGEIEYRIETNQNIIGRVFIESVNQKCNINSTGLLRGGFFLASGLKNCVQESVNRESLY